MAFAFSGTSTISTEHISGDKLMTNGELAFIALAEEKNFTKAAEKIYMSQQGLSDHIKRLEQDYNTTLVTRKPSVELTGSGRALYNMLLEKQTMDRDIRRLISDIDQGDEGEVRVGITSSRMRVISSDIIQKYHEAHPNVHIRIISDITVILMDMLEAGDLDLVIGVNPDARRGLDIEPVFDDPLYIAVPEKIALERSGDAGKVDISVYQDVPFIRDVNLSKTSNEVDAFLIRNNIRLNAIIEINDYNEQAALCNRLGAAMFCSKSFAFFSGGEIIRKGLRILEVEGLDHSVSICLVTSGSRLYPKCVTDFVDTARSSLKHFFDKHIA